MSTNVNIPALERPAFFDGQRLTANDLTEMQNWNRELRWLHNRGLHTWGIALGLDVVGQRGDRFVTVHPGYALDCQGRELILSQPQTIAVPAVAGASNGEAVTYYVTASYAEDADLPISETRSGVCQGSGAVRRPEQPRLRWQSPNDTTSEGSYRSGLDIILGTVQVKNCQLAVPVSETERRNARPAHQPYIAAGQTEAGATQWIFWPNSNQDTAVGVQTTVDTSLAGFGATPNYIAHMIGNREFYEPSGTPEFPEPGLLLDGSTFVLNPTPSSFICRLLLPRNLSLGPNYNLNADAFFSPTSDALNRLEKELMWHVVWMGVEG